jgi:hypothetical protein
MRRRDSRSTGPGQRLRLSVRCRECAARGTIDCAPHELVEALAALHSPECQKAHGVLAIERICAGDGCDNGAAAGKDYCGRCVR